MMPQRTTAKLLRFVPSGVLPIGVVAQHIHTDNCLLIDQSIFDRLDYRQRRTVIRSTATTLYDLREAF